MRRNPFLARRWYAAALIPDAPPTPVERPRLLFLDGSTVVNNAGDRLILLSQVSEP